MVGKTVRLKSGRLGTITRISYLPLVGECLFVVQGEDFLFNHVSCYWDEIETWW